MSYKKIVAGVATAVVASALVVPAAFAEVTYTGEGANVTAAQSNADTLANQLKELKEAKEGLSADTPKNEYDAKVKALNSAISSVEAAIKTADAQAKKAEAKADLEKAIAEAEKAQKENKGTATLESAINKAKDVLAKADEKSTDDLKNAKSDLDKAVKAVKDVNKDNKDAKQKLVDEVLAKADKALDQASWFKDGSDKVTVGDYVYTIDRLIQEIQDYRIKLGDKNFVDSHSTVELKGSVQWLDKAIDALNAKLKATDPAALTPYGVKAKEGVKADKKAEKKDVKVAKKGSALPKTSDVAPVAPIAAVAGSAALIAAGLVASRKVNA